MLHLFRPKRITESGVAVKQTVKKKKVNARAAKVLKNQGRPNTRTEGQLTPANPC